MIKLASALIILSFALSDLVHAAGFEILAAHRAVYNIKLESAEPRSGIKTMSGRIVYEIKGNECEGMAVRFRFVTNIRTGSDSFLTDQQVSSHESADGKQFSFVNRSLVNTQLERELAGKAGLEETGTVVTISKPEELRLELDPSQFTNTHLVSLIEAAKTGEVFVTADIFDGSGDGDKVLASTSVIGKPRVLESTLEDEEVSLPQSLSQAEAWPVTISYFDKNITNKSESLPVYETSFMLYENGISRQVHMRYPEYTLKAELSKIEILESTTCTIEN